MALPDPTSAMQEDFVSSIVDLGRAERSELASLVEAAQEQFFDLLDDFEPSEPSLPEEDALPLEFLRGSFGSAREVATYLDRIDARWRLDALMAVEGLLDELDETESMSWFDRLRRRITHAP